MSASHKWTREEIPGGLYAQDTPQVRAISVKRQMIFKGTLSSPHMQQA